MDPVLFETIVDYGLGAFALLLFYKLITDMNKRHSNDRKQDNELWRTEMKERSEKTDEVLKEFTNTVRDLNHTLDRNIADNAE